MKSALWLVVGVGVGFLAAHQVNRTPQGKALFDGLSATTREFTDAIVDGYRSREAELRGDADVASAASGP